MVFHYKNFIILYFEKQQKGITGAKNVHYEILIIKDIDNFENFNPT